MEKGLFGPNRYEITAIIPEKAVKTRWKAEKPAQGVNFVSKWYVTHTLENPGKKPGFSVVLRVLYRNWTGSDLKKGAFCPFTNHHFPV